MGRKLNLDDFIKKANKIHGDAFDYSLAKYVNVDTKIDIICNKHGVFRQTPYLHLHSKKCCPKCVEQAKKHVKLHFGINDLDGEEQSKAYRIWCCMISRCYSKNGGVGTYYECSVCEEWRFFSSFKDWFDSKYVEGYCLDKDILIKGNKIYSPDTCCFVPAIINAIFKKYHKKTSLPTGISKKYNRYVARYKGKTIMSSTSLKEAFRSFKKAKEAYIKTIAKDYYSKGMIDSNVFDAMMNYQVEFND